MVQLGRQKESLQYNYRAMSKNELDRQLNIEKPNSTA